MRKYDGTYPWYLARIVAVKDAEGNIVKWVGTGTDIDEIKLTSIALCESQTRLQRSLEATNTFLWERNLTNDSMTFVNATINSSFPLVLTFAEMMKSVHPNDKAAVVAAFEYAISTNFGCVNTTVLTPGILHV